MTLRKNEFKTKLFNRRINICIWLSRKSILGYTSIKQIRPGKECIEEKGKCGGIIRMYEKKRRGYDARDCIHLKMKKKTQSFAEQTDYTPYTLFFVSHSFRPCHNKMIVSQTSTP